MALDDDERRFQIRTLKIFVGVMLAIVLVVTAADLHQGRRQALVATAVALVGMGVAWRYLRQDRIRQAWAWLLAFGQVFIMFNVLTSGGLLARQLPALLVAVVVSGRMLGPRWALVFAGLASLFLLLLGQLHGHGVLPYPAALEAPPYRLASALAHLGALGTLCWYIFGRNAEQITRLQGARATAQASADEARQAGDALARSEQRFQDFARASGDWFWECDVQGRFTWISEGVRSASGMVPADYLGKTRVGLAAAQDDVSQEPWKSHLETLARREPFRGFLYRRPDPGGDRWFSASGVPVFDAAGTFTGYRGVGSDVTNRVAVEEEASRAGSRLRAAVEELSEAFLLMDRYDRILVANRRFREVNPVIVPLLAQGVTFEQFLRAACAQGYYPDAVGREEDFIAQRLAQRQHPGKPFEVRRADGTVLVNDLRLPDGGMVTMALDITERKAGERKLAESEARLRATLDNAPGVAIQQFDWSGHVLYWNHASEQLYGLAQEQVLGKTMDQLLWSADHTAAWLGSLRRSAASGKPVGPEESRVKDKDGTDRFFLSTSFSIPDSDHGHRFVALHFDISQRKQAEEELRRSEHLLEQVINAIPMAIFAKDTQSNYIMANAYFLRLVHMTREELLGEHTSRLRTPNATREKSLRDDEWVFTHRRTLDQPRTLLQDSEGRPRPFHSTKIPLLDDDGALTGLLAINRDISGELAAQETLRASEARFSALFHTSPVPQVVGLPGTMEAEDVNQAFIDLTGYPAERLLGVGSAGLVLFAGDRDREQIRQVMARGSTSAPIDLSIQRADGQERMVRAAAITIDTPMGRRLAWSFSDVTNERAAQRQQRELTRILERSVRERTEELTRSNAELQAALRNLEASQDALLRSEKLAALGRIVAGVAHELNTPIGNGLLAATTLTHATDDFVREVGRGLRRSRLDEFVASATEASAILQRNLERAAELVRSFKQVAVDQTTSHRRTFDLRDVIQEVALAHRPALRGTGVAITLDIPADLRFDSYPGPLGQVAANLVNNAVLHGYGESASGSIDIAASLLPDGQVAITVADHGRGIAEGDLGRIFDPFFTTRLGKGGSGLGLNIVHNIVTDVLGGSIAVDSAPGAGARFTITLPLVAPAFQDPSA